MAYEPFDAVTDLRSAVAQGAPRVHADLGSNVCFELGMQAPGPDAFASAWGGAPVVVEREFDQQRVAPVAIEPRAVTAEPATGPMPCSPRHV